MQSSSVRLWPLVLDQSAPAAEEAVSPKQDLTDDLRELRQDAVGRELPGRPTVFAAAPLRLGDLHKQHRVAGKQPEANSPGKRGRDDCKEWQDQAPEPVAPGLALPDPERIRGVESGDFGK